MLPLGRPRVETGVVDSVERMSTKLCLLLKLSSRLLVASKAHCVLLAVPTNQHKRDQRGDSLIDCLLKL